MTLYYKYYSTFPTIKATYGIVVQIKTMKDPFVWMPCRSDYISDCISRFKDSEVYRVYVGFLKKWYSFKQFKNLVKDPSFYNRKLASYN